MAVASDVSNIHNTSGEEGPSPPGRRGHDHQGMPNTEERAKVQTNHTSSEAGQPTNRRNRTNRAAAHKEQEPNGEETTLHGLGMGGHVIHHPSFDFLRQNLGSSSLTGKFEEPYNFLLFLIEDSP